MGRLLAWQLLQRGHQVSLYESGAFAVPAAAAWTAAGMVAPLSEAVVSDVDVYRMGRYALETWPYWLQQVPDAQACFQQHGSLVVAHPQDESELTQFHQDLSFRLPDEHSYRWVKDRDIRSLEPDLSFSFRQGLMLEAEGHLDNRRVLECLLAEIRRLGGHCSEKTPVEVAPGKIESPDGAQSFDCVIDCRGMGAKNHVSELRGVRGETLHVQTDEVQLQRPVRLMHPRYQLYIVPKPNHQFVIGATQIESEDLSPMSLQSSMELGSALYTLSPAFAEARILEQGVNLRPAFMDNKPRITSEPGLIGANGLFRHGYLLAPAIVDQVLALFEDASNVQPFTDLLMSDTRL